jgi:tRNA A-37 threonylcarbamoyl transferase component Bud32
MPRSFSLPSNHDTEAMMAGTYDSEDLGVLTQGGQGRVSLDLVAVPPDDARVRLDDGWVVLGSEAEPKLLCVKKAPATKDMTQHRSARAWGRISYEYTLLERAAGAGGCLPRVFDRVDSHSHEPWRNFIRTQYIHGSSLQALVEQGAGPDRQQLIDLASRLLTIVGGRDGSTGIHGRDMAHGDFMADQVIIPNVEGQPDWASAMAVDLGYGFHPEEVFKDAYGFPKHRSIDGGKYGYEPPERSAGYVWRPDSKLRPVDGPDRSSPDEPRRQLELRQRGDLWAWGMTVAYAATGHNIFDIHPRADGDHLLPPEWFAILRGEAVEPPRLAEVDEPLRPAIRAALNPSPDLREREAIAKALPPTTEALRAATTRRLRAGVDRANALSQQSKAEAGTAERTSEELRAQVDGLKAELMAANRRADDATRQAAEAKDHPAPPRHDPISTRATKTVPTSRPAPPRSVRTLAGLSRPNPARNVKGVSRRRSGRRHGRVRVAVGVAVSLLGYTLLATGPDLPSNFLTRSATSVGTSLSTSSPPPTSKLTPSTAVTETVTTAPQPPVEKAHPGVVLADDGGIFTFEGAAFHGSLVDRPRNADVAGIAMTPDGGGYWVATSDGGVFALGNAAFKGSGVGMVDQQVVGIAATPDGGGYWLLGRWGRVFRFGNAADLGQFGQQDPILWQASGIAPTSTSGYLVATEAGAVYAFPNSLYHGRYPGPASDPFVVDIAATPDAQGYWLLLNDGGVVTYGNAPFLGSYANGSQKPAVAIATVRELNGYDILTACGSVRRYTARIRGALISGCIAGHPIDLATA